VCVFFSVAGDEHMCMTSHRYQIWRDSFRRLPRAPQP
jgi:hypothetical protein